MIQRIQSLYLLIASALGFVSLFFNLGSQRIDGGLTLTPFNGHDILCGANDSNALYGITVIVIAGIITLSIFLFKNRLLQIKICKVLIFLIAINIALFALSFSSIKNLKPGFSAFVPPIQLILVFLALRAIKKDEEKVRSVDRLR
jgi:hypothetical protein